MISYRLIIVILVILIDGLSGFCQSESGNAGKNIFDGFVLDTRLHTGQIIKNWQSDNFPDRNAAMLLEVNIGRQTRGNKLWHRPFGFPQAGVSIVYGYLGNDVQLGRVAGVVPNMTFNTLSQKLFSIRVNLGMGFAYFNRPYNTLTNPNNLLIGSHITNMSYASLYIKYSMNARLCFLLGISVFHCSNSHYQIPNVGLNLPTFDIGLKYYPKQFPEIKKTEKHPGKKFPFRLNVHLGGGVHEFAETVWPVDGPKFYVGVVTMYLSKRYGNIGSLQFGLSAKNYGDARTYYTDSIGDSSNLFKKSTIASILVGNEFQLGRFSLLFQAGFDFYNPYNFDRNIVLERELTTYNLIKTYVSTRLGLQYYLFDPAKEPKFNTFVGAYINANLFQADFAEGAVGFVF